MVDPANAAQVVTGVVAGAVTVKKVTAGLNRLLGPAADEVATALQRFTEYKLRNVGRVVEVADSKTSQAMIETGTIPLRVASRIIEEGSHSDDEVVIEYLGGVLASSRTHKGRDDRGNTYAAMVASLSTYHLRLHYLCYSEFHRLFRGQSVNPYSARDFAGQSLLYYPLASYVEFMDFDEDERQNFPAILLNSLYALHRESLIELGASGNTESLKHLAPHAPGPGVVWYPTIAGMELFLWGMGEGQKTAHVLTSADWSAPAINGLNVEPVGMRVSEMQSPPVAAGVE